MTRQETQAVITVSLIVSLRLLGIFLLLPIFSAYAIKYPDATLPLVGVAFGIYALVQALLQIPFGLASDRFGRRRILFVGLFLFSLGSLICGMAENITQLILARVLQGSGAVSAVAMAGLGDLTRPQVRAQAFTIAGIAVGIAFIVGILGGPFLAAHFGFHTLFYLLAALSFFSMLLTGLFFPEINVEPVKKHITVFHGFMSFLEIRRIYVAAFVLSFVLSLFFFIYPLSWTLLGLDRTELWKVYLVASLPSILFVFPYVRYAEKKGRLRVPAVGGWIFIVLGFLAYVTGGFQKWVLYMTGMAFFLGYTLYQSLLPAFLTQRVPTEGRGAATGFYNLAGFFGASLGGILAGVLYNLNHRFPLMLGLLLLMVWVLMGLPNPPDSDAVN
ncbi:MAG TPA: MFS transporter [Thermodesulfobacteriota bacterium]